MCVEQIKLKGDIVGCLMEGDSWLEVCEKFGTDEEVVEYLPHIASKMCQIDRLVQELMNDLEPIITEEKF
jgi:hypothetical protein